MHTQQTHYFVPHPSKWPAIGAVALFCMGLGAALAVNNVNGGGISLGLGAAILIWMLFGWFGDVIRESLAGSYHNWEDHSFRWGMGWFIFSEVMFFAAFFGALFYVRQLSLPELSGIEYKLLYPDFHAAWPLVTGPGVKADYEAMGPWGLPAINTLILLSSGATLTWAHWGLIKGARNQLSIGLLVTVLLGALFLSLQMYEYSHAMGHFNLHLSSGAYGMTFFMLTGFHGMHVFLGTLILFVVWLRVLKGHFSSEHHFAFEAAAWYWHFVDVVWLLLFIFVYWI